MWWKANYNVFMYFKVNLLRCIYQQRQKTNTKNKCGCNGKVIIMYLSIPSVLCFVSHIYFRPDQECSKYD